MVQVLAHGWLPQSSDYYVDIELCTYNLAAWIRNNKRPYKEVEILNYFTFCLGRSELSGLSEELVDIMLHIALGLKYLHRCKIVHRD